MTGQLLFQLFGALARNKVVDARRRVVATFCGLVFLMMAAIFVFVGLFLLLETLVEPWEASFIVVALLLVMALIAFLTSRGRSGLRVRRDRTEELVEKLEKEALGAFKAEGTSLATFGAALAIGFLVGRRISK